MDSSHIVDVQFNRAVEIVQGLPKTGPIQTGYEEKLTMYRYVEATLLSFSFYTRDYLSRTVFINKVIPSRLA